MNSIPMSEMNTKGNGAHDRPVTTSPAGTVKSAKKAVDPVMSARAKSAVKLNGNGANNTTGTRVGGKFANKDGINKRMVGAGQHQA